MSDLFLRGLGNELQSESLAGSLPSGRNSPQRLPFGLHAEQLSGTAFTAPRHLNRRSWLYRRRPSVMHGPFKPLSHEGIQPAEINTPNRLRWNPPPLPEAPCDWLEGLGTLAGNGSISDSTGATIHLYRCNRPMVEVAFSSADGELLLAPQQGRLNLITEFGRLTAAPGEIALVPRGCRFRVEVDEDCRGYCLENHGAPFMLPDLGPIGSNGLASARDFLAPSAATEEDAPHRLIVKYEGRLWESGISHSPFDVVAWRGNLFPCTYDLAHFNVLGTISFDHPDPSIFTVLTSPSGLPGVANCDFVIFPPRWMVAEDTFRPPWFHRNFMSEYMGLIRGSYDARKGGFMPGGGSLHNRMSAHGPDRATTEAAQSAELAPVKYDDGLAFMFESMRPWRLTRRAMETDLLQSGYDEIWQGF